jgi:RNA recognition motif-containing protein
MARVYVGNLDSRVTSGELEDEFRVFGVLRRSLFFSNFIQVLYRYIKNLVIHMVMKPKRIVL